MEFFCLVQKPKGNQEVARTDFIASQGTCYGQAPKCPACGKFIGMREWMPPYQVDIELWGTEIGDLAFQGGEVVLASERFQSLFEVSKMSGLKPRGLVDVLSVKSDGKESGLRAKCLPNFIAETIVRSKTPIDVSASGFEWDGAPECPECLLGGVLKRWKSLVIDEKAWSGEDVFIARGLPGEIITTARFVDWCEANDIFNAVFVPCRDMSKDFYSWENTTGDF